MTKIIAMLAICFSLFGCANSTGLKPKLSKTGFDDATVVSVPPHGMGCKSYPCIMLGAQWQSNVQGIVYLDFKTMYEFTNMYSARLNIDGDIVELIDISNVTNHDVDTLNNRYSLHTFAIKEEKFEKILSAKKVWVQIKTDGGNVEDYIVDDEKDTKAIHALKRFNVMMENNS